MMDALFTAFAKILPDRIPASSEGGPTVVSISGIEQGSRWLVTDGILGAWGARPDLDGLEGCCNPGCNLSNMPIELIEAQQPLRIESYGFVANSGGAGKFRGGLAIERSYRLLSEKASLTLRSDRQKYLPQGLNGGWEGTPSITTLERNGEQILLSTMPMETLSLQQNDLVRHITAGAAGHGDPLTRLPESVLDDVRDGKIDNDYAVLVYGVVIDTGRWQVDSVATEKRRAQISDEGNSYSLENVAHIEAFFSRNNIPQALSSAIESRRQGGH